MLMTQTVAALGANAASIILMYAALGWVRSWRRLGMCVAVITTAIAPRIVEGPHTCLRFALALISVILIAKFYDLGIAACRSGAVRPSLASYLAFLPNTFALVYRTLKSEPQPPRSADWKRLAWGILGLWLGLSVAAVVFGIDWSHQSLILEHPAKVLALFGVLMPLDAVGVSLLRLAGGRGRQKMRHPYLAITPADFWRRYNRPVGHFAQQNVYRQSGARESPVWATFAVFLASGAAHEYLFAVTLGRVEGFQSAFFLLQGVAVAATLRLRPTSWRAWLGVALTLAFNLSTSLLFFASVGGILPFYAPGDPSWLRPRP
jgi:MBOAT, membrane-bound O-acyltransferase family